MNDKPTESELLKDPNKVLDDAYNKGVDDAMGVVKEEFIKAWGHLEVELYDNIISSLSKLKSNDSR